MPDRFNEKETWINYDPQGLINEKITILETIIPSDVKTILDVGCGNGIITNRLSENWDVTGVDLSAEALSYLKCNKIQASAVSIPVQDESYDLVLSSEMLEHLSASDFVSAIIQFKRISRKYIIVSVPNNENLAAAYARCPVCGYVFHAWQHQQTFSKKKVIQAFQPEFKISHIEFCGQTVKKWLPGLLTLKHALGQWMIPDKAPLCPLCGNRDFSPTSSNMLTKIINGINYLFAGKKHYWIMAKYEKRAL
jgi:2-polyprenyl-3-methyl-5-hydroxy-6-metoxy-1,4-benzoquinol methylase